MLSVASLDGNSDNRVWRSNIIRIAIYMTIPAAVGNATHILDCRFRDSANSCSHTDIAPAAAHSRGEMSPSRSNWAKAILRKNSTKQKACLQKFFHIMPTPRICRFQPLNSQGWLWRRFSSKSRISSACCRVKPISSNPFKRQCLRCSVMSNLNVSPLGVVRVCSARSMES